MFRWFFFCDPEPQGPLECELQKSRDGTMDRSRLLCWAILSTLVWAHVHHTVLNFVLVVACAAILSMVVNITTKDHYDPSDVGRGVLHLVLVVSLLSGATILTCQPVYMRYENLVKKVAVKEYYLWKYWCPDMYVTLASITVVSCVIRGIHKRLGL